MAEGDASRLENSIHWWAFCLVTAAGILMLGAALGLSIICDWTGIWIDFFLTVGAAVLLGALGIVGSGVLVTTVEREVKEVQRGIDETEAETAALEERLESQAGRLSTLADEVYENRQDQHDAQDAALAAMANDLTYEAVTTPLRQADLRRAISDAFRVPAFRDLNGMHMGFKYLIQMDRMVGGTPLLSLAPWFVDTRHVQSEGWFQGEDVTQVIARMDSKIESANLTPSMVWDPTLMFTNLRDSLELANRSLRGELARRLRGPLLERLNAEWVLTDEGLESLVSEALVPITAFPDTIRRFQDPGTPAFVPPQAPQGVDPDLWAQMIEIARVTYMVHGTRSPRRRGFSGI